ncbi:leucyl aminopeptidase [Candidatus Micrarchaeota archaeon]|nr:leucyl aminopeptidase [Candidatus Micrarchaeota archaeon]
MEFSVQSKDVWALHADARVLPRFEDSKSAGLPAKMAHALEGAKKKKLFSGKKGESWVFDGVVFVGLGSPESFKPSSLLRIIGGTYGALRRLGAQSVAVDMNGLPADAVSFAAQGLLDAAYRFDDFKKEKTPEWLEKIALASKAPDASGLLKKALVVAAAVRQARDIDNLPPNVAFPAAVAETAQKWARQHGLKCTVWDEKQLKANGCNAILAVGGGSVNGPRLAVLEYRGGGKSDPWVALVGKGVTFDSGGISLKPGADMDKMKFDKSGACVVLAAMAALPKLDVKKNVVAVVALAENLPSGSAYRPSDVVTSYSGKTIEVLNTDAEGRMVLADALGFVYAKYKPVQTVELATLTGACCVALGEQFAGMFGNDDALLAHVQAASMQSGDAVWRMPLDEFEDDVKSDIAEVKNVGHPKGYAGASTAAAFLKQFVSGPWVHLDIAGTSWNTSPKPYLSTGATGFGVRLLLEWLSQKTESTAAKTKK